MSVSLGWLALPLFVCACGSADPGDDLALRDSAGVVIVSIGSIPETGAALRVEPTPEVSIGVALGDEAYQFQLVRGAVRLTDGRIVVADNGSSQLRYFDSAGRHMRSAGGDGDGPGEFRFLASILRVPGDSIVAVSLNSSNALSLFDPAGNFVRNLSYLPRREPEGLLADRRALYVAYAGIVPPATTGHVQDEVVVILQPEGASVDTVFRVPGNQEYRQSFMNGIANGPVPFGRRVEVALNDDRYMVGVGSEGEVRVFEDGRLTRIIRFNGAREPLTREEIEAWKTWRTSRARNPAQATLAADFVAAQTFPDTRPVFSRLMAALDGSIWLERYEWNWQSTDAARWYVIDSSNSLRTVDMPPGLRPLEIGADYILGTVTDSLGVESVRAHRLVRSE